MKAQTVERETLKQIMWELMQENLLQVDDGLIYRYMGKRLTGHYSGDAPDSEIESALQELKTDDYYDIFAFYYRDGHTIEETADLIGCEESTVVRHKKRLVLKLYEEIISRRSKMA